MLVASDEIAASNSVIRAAPLVLTRSVVRRSLMLGRPGSRLRAIHSPCDSKPGGLVTEWVRRPICCTRLLELRLQAPVRWADLPGWFYHGKIAVKLGRVACDSHAWSMKICEVKPAWVAATLPTLSFLSGTTASPLSS